LIQEHGGSIEFQSTPGEGTAFDIRLPFAPIRDLNNTNQISAPREPAKVAQGALPGSF